jgi:hypothetical protein
MVGHHMRGLREQGLAARVGHSGSTAIWGATEVGLAVWRERERDRVLSLARRRQAIERREREERMLAAERLWEWADQLLEPAVGMLTGPNYGLPETLMSFSAAVRRLRSWEGELVQVAVHPGGRASRGFGVYLNGTLEGVEEMWVDGDRHLNPDQEVDLQVSGGGCCPRAIVARDVSWGPLARGLAGAHRDPRRH